MTRADLQSINPALLAKCRPCSSILHTVPLAWAALLMPLFAFLFSSAFGQDAVRLSMASSEAARERRQAADTLGYYNFKLGPTGWRFSSTLESDFEDNVRLTPHKEADGVFRPALNANMVWPVTDKNTLTTGS